MPRGIPNLPKCPEMKPCGRKDCIFRAAEAQPNNCNYLLITGHSRIKGLPVEERDPAYCKKYRKGHRKLIDAKAHLEMPFI